MSFEIEFSEMRSSHRYRNLVSCHLRLPLRILRSRKMSSMVDLDFDVFPV